MHTYTLSSAVIFLAAALAGCATPVTQSTKIADVATELEAKEQRKIAFETLFTEERRLRAVAYPIFTKAAPLCADKLSYGIGARVINKHIYATELHEAAFSLYGITDVLKVTDVHTGSPAYKAGLLTGDIPVTINDWAVPVDASAVKAFHDKVAEFGAKGEPLAVKVTRNGAAHTLSVTPEKICDYGIALISDDTINAYADGKNVVVTRGMMRFTNNDNELALVVAHELAHNTMGHLDKRKQNYWLGSVFDILIAAGTGVNTQGLFGNIAAQSYSQEFETEADYVGLYMMALTGLNIQDAPKFWRRMAALSPDSIKTSHAGTHPATPQRFLALEGAAKEIAHKRQAGLPLRPEMKSTASESPKQSQR